MIGVVGADANARIVRQEFEKRGVDTSGIVEDPARQTNTYGKLRAGGHNIPMQEVLRTDTPKPQLISGAVEEQVVANIYKYAPASDAILIGDQVTSTITDKVLAAIVECAKKYNLKTVADSRKRAGMFHGIDVVVPNDAEAGLAAGVEVRDETSLRLAGQFLLQSAKNAFITRGPHGITIFAQDGSVEDVGIPPIKAVDVTGAGDTVAAAVVLTLAAGGSLRDAAFLGNTAAGIAVVQEGVVTVSRAEVEEALAGGGGPAKLKTLDQLRRIVAQRKEKGERLVWTNGCFDLLHVGHITYLMKAREQGDALILGLNSDASVRALKGPERPVVHEQDRALVMSALECVDYVTIFDDETPLRLLQELQPDVYAKGGDYTLDSLVQEERRLVESYGGEIALIAGVDGQATTRIIDKIRGEV